MFEIKILTLITYIIRAYEWLDLFSIDNETSLQRKVTRKLKFTIFLSFPVVVMLGSFQNENRGESLYLLAVSMCSYLHAIKLHYICTKMELISVLLKDLSVHSCRWKENFNETEKTLKNFNYFSTGLIAVSSVMCCLVFGFPLVFKKTLAFKIWFPLDSEKNDFNFWIAHTYISFCIFICTLMVTFTVLTWYLMLNCAIKYRVLGSNLESLGFSSLSKRIPEAKNSKLFYEDFVECFEHYKTLKCNMRQLSSCFHLLFFGQIVTSGAGICTTVYSLSFDSTSNIIQNILNFYLLTFNIFDIFMITHFGNEIKLAHGKLSNCLFNSIWVDQPIQLKKIELIFMIILNQTEELVIGKLYPLDLATFTSILKGAYSMFNILQNLK